MKYIANPMKAALCLIACLIVFTPAIGGDLWAKCGVETTHRGNAARLKFMRQTGYPHGRPGWIVDHIIPLCKGGKDDPSNMQWQTLEEARAKDKWECVCAKR